MPKAINVTATVPANEKEGRKAPVSGSITVQFVDIDTDPKKAMAEAITMFGEKAILSNALGSWVISLQNTMRAALKKGENSASLQARLNSAKMGVALQRQAVDQQALLNAKLMEILSMPPAEQAKYIAELKAKAAAK